LSLQLLSIGDDDIRLLKVGKIGRCASDFDGFRKRGRSGGAFFHAIFAEELADFSERRPAALPAAVTPSSARKRQGCRQKVGKPSFFLDRQAI
jgi:hypothetical protein